MTTARQLHPRLALAMTIVPDGATLHLIAGEDVRYSLHTGAWTEACAALLRKCDGTRYLDSLLAKSPDEERARLRQLIERLYGERILVDGPVEDVHEAQAYQLQVAGAGPLAERLRHNLGEGQPLRVLCQESLDYAEALAFNRQCLASADSPWLWATTGPASRALVSPVFLPRAGPCLACLWRHFRRLSPAPALYDALVQHGERQGEFSSAGFAAEGLIVVELIVRWKQQKLRLPSPAPATYRLPAL
jgi:hypothetical protein